MVTCRGRASSLMRYFRGPDFVLFVSKSYSQEIIKLPCPSSWSAFPITAAIKCENNENASLFAFSFFFFLLSYLSVNL